MGLGLGYRSRRLGREGLVRARVRDRVRVRVRARVRARARLGFRVTGLMLRV